MFFAFFLLTLFLIKPKIKLNIQVYFLYGLLVLIGVVGVVNYGMLGAGMHWLISSVFFLSLLRPHNVKVIYSTFIAILLLSSIAFFHFFDNATIELSKLIASPLNWLGTLLPIVSFNFIFIMAFTSAYEKIRQLISKIESQNVEIEKLANYDELTGAATLRLAKEKVFSAVELAKRNTKAVGIIYIDLDGFKSINDNYGHDAGDTVLKGVSYKITNELRSSDCLCRIGGDEFLVILAEIGNEEQLRVVAKKLISTISTPITYRNTELHVSASMGLSSFPESGNSFDRLISVADTNMYIAKKEGKNRFYPL
ncbi:GGDEF domain-containing protein [Rheinheimera sp. NSM]|uniref:GGDEF domain-containing protein n=1 Tax=Rheinheimera sp. NSM TaxID=3457884 RepID=UPI004037444B